MSYVKWSSVWHVVLPDALTTVCGRPVEEDAHFRTIPPIESLLCSVCRRRA